MAARRIRSLTDSEMAAITQRQAAEQTAWRKRPSAGTVVACRGEDFEVLAGVFPPKADTGLLIDNMIIGPNSSVLDMAEAVGLKGSLLAEQAMQEDDPRVYDVISFTRR